MYAFHERNGSQAGVKRRVKLPRSLLAPKNQQRPTMARSLRASNQNVPGRDSGTSQWVVSGNIARDRRIENSRYRIDAETDLCTSSGWMGELRFRAEFPNPSH